MSQLNVTGTAEESDRDHLKMDAFLANMQSKTPAEINTWVEANLLTVPDMRNAIKMLLKAVVVLSRNV